MALLFARNAARGTPEVGAGVLAETCERLLSQWEPRLGPIWGLDARHPPAKDAHVGTAECIHTVHRDRCIVDNADTSINVDLKLLGAPRHMYDPTVSPGATEGSHSDDPAESPSEPACPPHSDAMGNAGPARGVGVAADAGLPEGVKLVGTDEGLDEGVAPGSRRAEAAASDGFELPEVDQFLRTPTEVCVPAAPLRKSLLIRKRLVPASVAVCAMDALASKMDTLTVCEPPRCDACEQGKSAAVGAIVGSSALPSVDDATLAAEQEVPLVVTPSKAVNTVRVESRRVAAARKKAALIIDEFDLKQANGWPLS